MKTIDRDNEKPLSRARNLNIKERYEKRDIKKVKVVITLFFFALWYNKKYTVIRFWDKILVKFDDFIAFFLALITLIETLSIS